MMYASNPNFETLYHVKMDFQCSTYMYAFLKILYIMYMYHIHFFPLYTSVTNFAPQFCKPAPSHCKIRIASLAFSHAYPFAYVHRRFCYIFYSSDFLTPISLLGPVSTDWLKQYKIIGCPNPHFPSDHFPLLCEYDFIA